MLFVQFRASVRNFGGRVQYLSLGKRQEKGQSSYLTFLVLHAAFDNIFQKLVHIFMKLQSLFTQRKNFMV